MADLAVWQRTIVDEEGNVIPGAEIEVRREEDGSLATLYADRAGETPLANPLAADMSGFVRFFAQGDAYTITAVGAGSTRTWRFDPTGRLQEFDRVSEALVADDAADLLSARSNLGTFSTVAEVQSRHIPPVLESIRTLGWAAPGDGGGALYKRVESEPSHAGKIQSADGAWWEQVPGAVVRVEQFGVGSPGVNDDAAFKAAAAFAAATTGSLHVRSDVTFTAPWDDYPDGLTLVGDGPNAKLRNIYIELKGAIGSPVTITGDVPAGSLRIPVSSTSPFSAGGIVRLVSCINANSPDAWPYSMGNRSSDNSYIAEFVEIAAVEGSELVLKDRTLFPYASTPGPDSGGRTSSVVYPLQMAGGLDFKNLVIEGIPADKNTAFHFDYCKDITLDNCRVDLGNREDAAAVIGLSSWGITLDGGRYAAVEGVEANSNANIVKFRSCQDCVVQNGATLVGGNQSVDVTYRVNDPAGGGPSIHCGANHTTAYGAGIEPYSDHPGNWGTQFNYNVAYGCRRSAIRIRSRNGQVLGNRVYGLPYSPETTNRGILVQGLYTSGALVADNYVKGFYVGIVQAARDVAGEYNDVDFDNQFDCMIDRNNIEDCVQGIRIGGAAASNKVSSRVVRNNTIVDPSEDAITISEYSNGAFVEGNLVYGVGTDDGLFYSAINLSGNSSNVVIGPNYSFNAKANSRYIIGPITAGGDPFITDTITFPGGDSDAGLVILPGYTDSAAPVSRMSVASEVFRKPVIVGGAPMAFPLSTSSYASGDAIVPGTGHLWLDESNNEVRLQIRTGGGLWRNVTLGTWEP